MTQFKQLVEAQRQLLEAEKYRDELISSHTHKVKSMWYESRPTDTEYMDGRIERTLANGKTITMVKGKKGQDLVREIQARLSG
jgi:hypothetical protein